MAEHLIYHWKHGWIPLTHAAAMSKAKGNSKLADKFVPGASTHHSDMRTAGLSARTIHGTLTPHERHHSAAADVAKLRHGDQATVHGMDEYGQPMSFTGRVSGVPTAVRIKQGPNGKVEPHFAVQMHNGSEGSNGVDATARTTVYVKNPDGAVASLDARRSERAAQTPHEIHDRLQADPKSVSDKELTRLIDTGGRFAPAARDEQRRRDVAKMQAQGINEHDNFNARTGRMDQSSATSDAQRVQVGITQAGHRAFGNNVAGTAQQAGGGYREGQRIEHEVTNFSKPGFPKEWQAGTVEKITKRPDGLTELTVRHDDGSAAVEMVGKRGGNRTVRSLSSESGNVADHRAVTAQQLAHDRVQAAAAARSADASKRVQVDHSGDGTTLEIDRTDTQAREAVKAAGFRWSNNLKAWYLPRTYSEPTRRQKVEQVTKALGEHNVHVNDGGRGATTTAAEREAATRAAAADRAVRMDARAQRAATEADVRFGRAKAIGDMIPFGQPILVGHHSEGRHRRDLAKIDSNMRKGFDAQNEADAAARAAENARRTAEGDSPLMRQRRIDRNEAELRKIDRTLQEHRIATKAPEKAARVGIRPVSADYHDQLTTRRAELADQIAHDKAQIEASGHKTVSTADVSQGDLVQYRGQWHIAKKVNKTTVSVPTGYSWDDKIPANQITGHKKLVDMPESALKAGAGNGSLDPKLRAAYVRELNRRGIHLGNAS